MDNVESAIRNYCEKGGLFVCSTGNKEQDNDLYGQHHYPSFYASELYSNPIDNMITVGRSDINDERPNGANFGDETIMLYAPGELVLSTFPADICTENDHYVSTQWGNLLACQCTYMLYDGVYQWVPTTPHIANGYHLMSGSSMATPYVSGVAALLLSIDPQLTASQLKEAILNSVEIPNVDGNNPLEGLCVTNGRLNAYNALKYVFENFTDSLVLQNESNTYTKVIDSNGDYFDDKNCMVKLYVPTSEYFDISISANNSFNVTLYDSNLNEIGADTYTDNETTFTRYLSAGTYYLRINYVSDYSGLVTITTQPHTHEYTEWKYYSKEKHIESCECGHIGTYTTVHVAAAGSIGNFKGLCMYCGAILNFIDDGHIGIMNINKYSINGSYILPNGIIVLVDEDIEAYESGTLVFYDKDDLPVVQ